MLKKVWKSLLCYCNAMGRARAASELARMGYMAEAKNLMLEVDKC